MIKRKYCECNHNKLCLQAFTKYICKECGIEKSHSNTCVPKYCPECAEKLMVCDNCGLQVNLFD